VRKKTLSCVSKLLACRLVDETFAELNFPGRLIAVEGLDGSGKSTQIYLLKRWLELQGLKVYFSEWNSSEWSNRPPAREKARATHRDNVQSYPRHRLCGSIRASPGPIIARWLLGFMRSLYFYCLRPRRGARLPSRMGAGLYDFAALPDLTFFFKADLGVSLQRILDGRPQLKYFEAGMDMHLSSDPYESFRIFQGRMLEQYLAMSTEFGFLLLDANQLVEKQQAIVRELIAQKLNLAAFRRAEPPHPRRATPAPKTAGALPRTAQMEEAFE
jgi:dTMP kinase